MKLPTGSESLRAPHCRSRVWLLVSKFSFLSARQVSKDRAMASRSVGPVCSSLVAATLSKPQLNVAQEGTGNNLAEREMKKAKLHGSRWELVALYFFLAGRSPEFFQQGKNHFCGTCCPSEVSCSACSFFVRCTKHHLKHCFWLIRQAR